MGSHAMTDIVERLRICAKYDPDQAEAADEIERLRGALREIASIDYRGPMPDGVQIARKALGEKE